MYPWLQDIIKRFLHPKLLFGVAQVQGIENFAKIGNSIYFGKGDSLYINLFIAFELILPEKGFSLRQETEFPKKQETTLTLTLKDPSEATIMLRVPNWLAKGYSIKVNKKMCLAP